MNPTPAEPAVRALIVSSDPPTVEELSQSLEDLAASTEVCADFSHAIRLLNTRKFEAVVVDFTLGQEVGDIPRRVRFSLSNPTTVVFAVTGSAQEAAIAFEAGCNFVLERPLATTAARVFKTAYGLMLRERLNYFRYSVSIPVTLRNRDMSGIRCETLNVSQGGMALITTTPLKPGTEVCVEFTIPGERTGMAVGGEICWHDDRGRAGLRFREASSEQSSQLRSWLSRALEDTLPERVAAQFKAGT